MPEKKQQVKVAERLHPQPLTAATSPQFEEKLETNTRERTMSLYHLHHPAYNRI
jgi:hypothetical protein